MFAGLVLLFSCHNATTPSYDPSLQIYTIPPPQPITFRVDSVYPHDSFAFTQGLEYYKGKLFEGTGHPDRIHKTSLRIVDIKTGKPEKEYITPDSTIFGEGITIFRNKIYQLTWQSHIIVIYNLNDITHPISTYPWNYDGWGLTNDGTNLISSDGSSKLYYMVPDEFKKEMKITKILTVSDNNGELDSLNELEYITGYIFANRWYNDHIYKIDPTNGHVVGVIDFTGLLHQYDPKDPVGEEAVLNGIAYDSTARKLFITGKDWPKLFEITLNSN